MEPAGPTIRRGGRRSEQGRRETCGRSRHSRWFEFNLVVRHQRAVAEPQHLNADAQQNEGGQAYHDMTPFSPNRVTVRLAKR